MSKHVKNDWKLAGIMLALILIPVSVAYATLKGDADDSNSRSETAEQAAFEEDGVADQEYGELETARDDAQNRLAGCEGQLTDEEEEDVQDLIDLGVVQMAEGVVDRAGGDEAFDDGTDHVIDADTHYGNADPMDEDDEEYGFADTDYEASIVDFDAALDDYELATGEFGHHFWALISFTAAETLMNALNCN